MEANTRYDILKTELLLCQHQMDKYDTLSVHTKAWAVTLWAASIGWAFQVQQKTFILLSLVVLITFWLFDSLNKTFRENYKRRRDEVAGALEHFFQNGSLPEGISAPQLPKHRTFDMLKKLFLPHLLIPYLFLALIAIAIYFNAA